jgi:hypothetical protein
VWIAGDADSPAELIGTVRDNLKLNALFQRLVAAGAAIPGDRLESGSEAGFWKNICRS